MLYCDKCRLSVAGHRDRCPLCQGVLSGESGPETFPVIPTGRHQYHLVLRMLIFLSITAVVVSGAINVMFPAGKPWAFFVALAVGCMWVSLYSAIIRRHNLPKNISWQVFLLSLLAVLWDELTGWHAWSTTYVIPSLCIFAMAAMAAISKAMKLQAQDCLIYLVIDGLFGFVPLVFLGFGWVTNLYLPVICVAASIISLAALFSFEGENLVLEIKKRLHL